MFLMNQKPVTSQVLPDHFVHSDISPGELLHPLRSDLITHLDLSADRQPVGGLGIFHCRGIQKLREVPILQPFAILVVAGKKRAIIDHREIVVSAGELLLLPAGFTLWMENHPDTQSGIFVSLGMGFSAQTLARFRQQQISPGDIRPVWQSVAAEPVITAYHQWFQWCQQHPVEPVIAGHRQLELLLLLAQAGLAGNLLLGATPSWKQRVVDLLSLRLSDPWKLSEVCSPLAVSESTLRRHLRAEQTSFREILEQTRLVNGLGLLQETCWPIARVAESVGYQSASRFSERFKQRFGMSPSELRRTQANAHLAEIV